MSLMDQQSMQAPQSGGDYGVPPAQPPTPYPPMTPNMSKGGTVPRRVQKFATGGYASSPISGSATGMPAASPIGGYTPGPNANAVGSWGAGAEAGTPGSGGANYAPQGSPGANPWSGGSYNTSPVPQSQVAAAAAGGYEPPAPQAGGEGMAGGGGGGGSPTSWYSGSAQQAQQESLYGNSANGPDSVANTPGEVSQEAKAPNQYADSNAFSASALAEGGPVPGIKHTSKKSKSPKKFAAGGPVGSGPGHTLVDDDCGEGKVANDANEDGTVSAGEKCVESAMPSMKSTGAGMLKSAMGSVGMKKGGAVPSFDDGGGVPDPDGAIPSDPTDPSDTSDTGQGQQGQAGDQGSLQNIANQVKQVASATRQQFGLNDASFSAMAQNALQGNQQTADNSNIPRQIPPAPGGAPAQGTLQDTPAPMKPFNPRDFIPGGSKSSGIPGDTQTAAATAAQGEQTDQTVSAAEGGAIPAVWSTKHGLGKHDRSKR